MKKNYQPKHAKHAKSDEHERTASEVPTASPLGIPFPDPDGEGEYIPMPGDNRVGSFTPNGVLVRNPWSEQPEVKPDNAYTDDKEDLDLLIM